MDSPYERFCSELVPRERSGHTAVVVDNQLYVWGGYTSLTGDGRFLPTDEIWVYDFELGAWEVFHMAGYTPPSLTGTCGCSLNGHMYLFGGRDDSRQTNQIYCVNLTDGKYTWRNIVHESGDVPSPREDLCCWVYNGRIIYFGGYGFKTSRDAVRRNESFRRDEGEPPGSVIWGWNNEVHIFDPVHASWSEPNTHGQAPSPRSAHASATLGFRGYVCGGRVTGTRTTDIHCLDLESWTWSEIIPVSTSPKDRSWHTLTAVSDASLFLFGGVGCGSTCDGWLLDVQTKKWREVEHPFKNESRMHHTASADKDSDVMVFGGSMSSHVLTGNCNDSFILQMQPYPLYKICVDYIAKNVRNYDALRNRLPLLPSNLLTAVQKRRCFYRPSKLH